MAFPFLFFPHYSNRRIPPILLQYYEQSVILVVSLVIFLCTTVNSALTTTIVGVLKGVGSTTLGFVLLGGVAVHALNVNGLVTNTFGGVWYSYAKYKQKKKTPRKMIMLLILHPVQGFLSSLLRRVQGLGQYGSVGITGHDRCMIAICFDLETP